MSRVRGKVQAFNRSGIVGWAQDEAAPERIVQVEVMMGDRRIAAGPASIDRPAYAALGIGRTNVGFAIPLPAGIALDLEAMTVREPGGAALVVDEGAGVLEGVFEKVDGRLLGGWAWRCGHPRERVTVVVRHRGQEVARALAEELREDLGRAGVGDGRHAFHVNLRVIDPPFEPEKLTIEFEDGTPLHDLRPGMARGTPSISSPPSITETRPQKLFVQKADGAAAAVAAPVRTPTPSSPRPQPQPAAAAPRGLVTVPRPGVRIGAANPAQHATKREEAVPAAAPVPPAVPAPPPSTPSAAPSLALSPEAFEAMRGALDFGGELDDTV